MPILSPLRAARLAAVALLAATALAAAPAAEAACPANEPNCPYSESHELGKNGQGVFRFPQAVAVSPDAAHVYVADAMSYRVQKFTRTGEFVKEWGSYGKFGRGRFRAIGGIAVDTSGRVYVVDQNNRIQVFDENGDYLRQWGKLGTKPGQFHTGINGGVSVFGNYVYVADQENHRIQRFELDPATGAVNLDPASIKIWGRYGDCSVKCSNKTLSFPEGITVDAVPGQPADVFVADNRNHRVMRYDADGRFRSKLDKPGLFASVYDVGIDRTHALYVADNDRGPSSTHHRVRKFDASSLAPLGNWGGFGSEPGQFKFPRALAALAGDPAGGVFVADTANNRIQGFDANGNLQTQWGVSGRDPGSFTRPAGIAVAPGGAIYVADTLNHRLQELTPDGEVRRNFFRQTDGSVLFSAPTGVAVHPSTGEIYVVDRIRHRIQHYDPASDTWAPLARNGLKQPHSVALDAAGNVFVADTGHDRIVKLDVTTGTLKTVGQKLKAPTGVAIGPSGRLYAANTGAHRIVAYDASRRSWRSLPASGLRFPATVSVDPAERLIVADTNNHRVVRLDASGRQLDAWGTQGPRAGKFTEPSAAAADRSGNVFVTDRWNNRVQVFTLSPTPPALASPPPGRGPDTLAPRVSVEAKRGLTVGAARKSGVTFRTTCTEACSYTGALSVDASTAAKLGLANPTVGTIVRAVRRTGEAAQLRIRLNAAGSKALAKARTPVTLTLRADVADSAGNKVTIAPRLPLRPDPKPPAKKK